MAASKFVCRLAAVVPKGMSLEEVAKAIPAELRDDLAVQKGQLRFRVRKTLVAAGYDKALVDAMIPRVPSGVKAPMTKDSPWHAIGKPARTALAEKVGEDYQDSASWTAARASLAADAITELYVNGSTASVQLTRLRVALRAIGVAPEIIAASLRPDVTMAANSKIAASLAAKVEAGVEPPERFRSVAELTTRVQGYADDEKFEPTGLAAADLLVVFSARPGEAETLKIGPYGGVVGALKKRASDGTEYPIVSAVGPLLATAFMKRWTDSTLGARRAAMRELAALTATWGCTPHSMRGFGAALAVNAAVLAGEAASPAAQRAVQVAALRHAKPAVAAVDHYSAVTDSGTGELAAKIRELEPEQILVLKSLIDVMRRTEAAPAT